MEIRLYVFRKNFNPRSPHGERLSTHTANSPDVTISIHAPRTGSDEHLRRYIILCDISIHAPRTGSDDAIIDYQSAGFTDFNPRSPHGERHSLLTGLQSENEISIHAPRTGSDNQTFLLVNVTCRFQSTLPARGATWCLYSCKSCQSYFNPRSPHGERLRATVIVLVVILISIHAPRTGSDMSVTK